MRRVGRHIPVHGYGAHDLTVTVHLSPKHAPGSTGCVGTPTRARGAEH